MKAARILSAMILTGTVLLISAEAFAKDRTKGRGTVLSCGLCYITGSLLRLDCRGRFPADERPVSGTDSQHRQISNNGRIWLIMAV